MPAGRPSDYKPEYCEKVIALGKEGASVVRMACEIGVARATLEANWTAEHPEFLEAFTLAKQYSQDWWEEKGRECLIMPQGATFQSSVWSRSMAARFPADWRENSKHEVSGIDGKPIETKNETVIRIVRPDA